MTKWSKEEIENEVSNLDNDALVDRTVYAAMGDDYDGCFTSHGAYEFEVLRKELSKRLKAVGFVSDDFTLEGE